MPPQPPHRRPVRHAAALVCSAALLASAPLAAQNDCAKRVFNRFCLGGPAHALPDAAATEAGGQLRFDDDGKAVYVELRDGRVAHVWREETPGSWINYLEWRNKLIRVYGRGVENNDFPPSSKSRSARHNAVVAGKGRATTVWDQVGWQVAVVWDNPDNVRLSYRLRADAGDTDNSDGL